MASKEGLMTDEEAQDYLASAKALFNQVSSTGEPLELVFQGVENYYLTDPRERDNFQFFLDRVSRVRERTGNNSVLVAPCSFGFEMELLAQRGFDVSGFDIADSMVNFTRNRLDQMGIPATLHVDDVTNLDSTKYAPDYAGVMCVNVAPGIPVVENDALFRKAVRDLTALTPEGVFYLSNTQYSDPKYQREWTDADGKVLGATTYFARPARSISEVIRENGLSILRCEHYDSARDPENEYSDYMNDYLTATR